MTITIRHLEPGDYAPIIRVLNDWWGGRRMADMLPRLFFVHFRPTSFAAEVDGKLAGFLAGFVSQTHREQAYIHFVGVDPAFRAAGVGRALYERFFETVRAVGVTEVHGVTSPSNERSLAFHTAMGFELLGGDAGVGHSPDYDGPGEPRVRLRKKI
jgi:GNAT superfamily N-acetyltransferase